jgi:hypothetical protein
MSSCGMEVAAVAAKVKTPKVRHEPMMAILRPNLSPI